MKYRLSSRGVNFISGEENLKLTSYQDSAGIWTIGFGTTKLNGFPVGPGMVINEPVASALFYGPIQDFLLCIDKLISVPLNQNQIDALCSFTYNLGCGALESSRLRIAINHKLLITEDLFTSWNKARVNGQLIPVSGLTKRRTDEFKLYTSEEGL